MAEDLIEQVDGVDVSLLTARGREKDWQDFLKLLRKRKLPTEQELGLILGRLNSEEAAMFSNILMDIEATSPNLSSFQKKFIALSFASMIKEKEFEDSVIDLAMQTGLSEEQVRELEAKSRVLNVLNNKKKFLLEHISKNREIDNRVGILDDILNDPDILEFQMKIKRRRGGSEVVELNDNVSEAEYEVVDEG